MGRKLINTQISVKELKLKISTNVNSLMNQRRLGNVRQTAEREQIRMASGNQITKAADDPAGLAIAETMRAKIRSYGQAGRNAADGISVLQVADGTLNQMSGNVIRLRELAMQAATDTFNDHDRQLLQLEFSSAKNEVKRQASSTEFSSVKVLSGDDKRFDLQVGLHNDQNKDRISYNLKDMVAKVEDSPLWDVNISTKFGAQNSLKKVDDYLQLLNNARAKVGSTMKRMESVGQGIAIASENHSASRSKIADTDYALSAAKSASAQLNLNAGTSVLTQVNNMSRGALRLLE
ncbi:MAG: flagellin FliC [Halobacteriovorax sp.]|nr:flagellin FliC [Halobacteriovorax sp.]